MDEFARSTLRLAHPGVIDPQQRMVHARFLRIAFAMPALAPLVAMTIPGADVASVLAWTCAAMAISWGGALLALVRGRIAAPTVIVILAFATGLAAAMTLGGSSASPLLLLFAAIPVESWWILRDRRAARLSGFIAFAAAIVVLANDLTGSASFLDWLAPAFWAATLWPRREAFQTVSAPAARTDPIAKLTGGAFLRIDTAGMVETVTGETETLLGLDNGQLAESGFFDRLHVADRVAFLRTLSEVRNSLKGRHIALRLRAPAAAPGDDSGHIELALELMAVDGGILGWLHAAPTETQAAPATGEDDERLEIAKARFLAAVSHELRTPLNAIIGFSDILLHGLFGPFADPRQREYVALISESGGHLLNVVNAILDVSKIEAGAYSIRPEPFRWNEAVDMSVQMIARQAEARNIAVAVEDESGGEDVIGDRRAIQQILINLLSNAVKFTQEGGSVVVSARRRPGIFEFSVADNGIGIAEEDLNRLGRPFTQIENDLSRSFDGAGLGLSLVKGLVELHHGSMSIESALGNGTTVRIGLPDNGPKRSVSGDGEPEIEHEAQRKFG